MGFNRRKMEDQRRQVAEKEAAARRATDAQVLEDAERLIAAWNERQAKRMPMLFSPTIGAAITAGYWFENIFKHVLGTAGKEPFAKITTATVMAGRDRRANTPSQARHFLDSMRGLFRWAVKSRLIKTDPTLGVDNPPLPKNDGFASWSEDEIAAYERRWPIGTRQRVWLDVVIYTGLRRGDAVRLGRQYVRAGVATIKTEKTGTEVTLPILPILAKTLEAGPCGDLTFVAGENGRPLTKESFGNLFRKACRDAGLQNRSAHGLRKAAATRAANAGATVAELEAIFGWQGGTMAALYTRAADRRRLAQGAMHKLARTTDEQTLPAPEGQTTRTLKNTKKKHADNF